MLAVESKWYKQTVGRGFVADEFGPDGQLRTALESLYSLFDPQQHRLDRDYWQRTLYALLDEAPTPLKQFRQEVVAGGKWSLLLDGLVYVHQYTAQNPHSLASWSQELHQSISQYLTPADLSYLSHDKDFNRLRLKSYPQLIELLTPRGSD